MPSVYTPKHICSLMHPLALITRCNLQIKVQGTARQRALQSYLRPVHPCTLFLSKKTTNWPKTAPSLAASLINSLVCFCHMHRCLYKNPSSSLFKIKIYYSKLDNDRRRQGSPFSTKTASISTTHIIQYVAIYKLISCIHQQSFLGQQRQSKQTNDLTETK